MNIPMDLTNFDTLKPEIERVKALRSLIQNRLNVTPNTQKIDRQDITDVTGALTMLEILLCKYQERRDIRSMLEGIRDSIQQAADCITAIDDEISDMNASSEESCRRIDEARLSIHSPSSQSDRDSVRRILDETSQRNFTTSTNKTNHSIYKNCGKVQ